MAVDTLIIDDEASARSRLRKLLAAFPGLSIAGEARDGLEALAMIRDQRPDLVFLDVQMPGLDGFEVLRALPPAVPPPLVIFVTAYDQYALAAFEANALAYLLKPVNRTKLGIAVDRARQLVAVPQRAAQEQARLRELIRDAARPLEHVVARVRDRYVLIPTADVCFFRVEDEIVRMRTESATFQVEHTLADLVARLPDPPFFRARRSVVVNLRKIKEIAPMFKGSFVLVMKDKEGSEIQVSERQSKYVRELLRA
jgi:two-component system, LytTR family, response regulator